MGTENFVQLPRNKQNAHKYCFGRASRCKKCGIESILPEKDMSGVEENEGVGE